ncbi:MAG: secretin N-terminal domain-containing protein [Opitutaceae bacterium]|nr:secretin N-terminal domain-containing protein [Opitutaceae bacterium]
MKTKLSLIALMGLAAACGWVRAQEATPSAPDATAPASAPVLAGPSETPAAAVPTDGVGKHTETLSVDFPDDEIRNILRNVADLFELNLVIPDTLQGKTSVKLRDVTWRQIFKVVLNPVGYTYIEDGNIIRVVTIDSLNLEPAVTEVFILNYAKASDVKPALDSMVDAKVGGKIVVDARSNALLVTERPSAINRIKPIIARLDRPTDQVMIETKFIDVTDGDQKNIGINWTSLQGYGVGTEGKIARNYTDAASGKTAADYTNRNNDVDYMLKGYRDLDQVANKNNPGSNIGLPYKLDKDTGAITYDGGPTSNITNNFATSVARATTAVLSADQFRVVLSALRTLNRSKLVSNPTIVTLNNTEASINIGREYPIPNYTYNQERGVFEVSGFQYKPIGVILKVTPQVNSAGFIRLTVEPEVSSSNENVSFGGSGGASIPIIQVRKTKTQITLKDGFTLGIGGLVEENKSNSENKVPLLGDIPGLGRLFRHKSANTTAHNLVVFITAKTIKPDGAEVGEIFDPRMTRAMEVQKSDLPGYRDGSDSFYTPPPVEKKGKKKD